MNRAPCFVLPTRKPCPGSTAPHVWIAGSSAFALSLPLPLPLALPLPSSARARVLSSNPHAQTQRSSCRMASATVQLVIPHGRRIVRRGSRDSYRIHHHELLRAPFMH